MCGGCQHAAKLRRVLLQQNVNTAPEEAIQKMGVWAIGWLGAHTPLRQQNLLVLGHDQAVRASDTRMRSKIAAGIGVMAAGVPDVRVCSGVPSSQTMRSQWHELGRHG